MKFVDYTGKRVVVSGCYSGMGAATASLLLVLGAEVHGLDFRDSTLPLASFTRMDLRDPASIEAAANGIDGRVDALFNCAGVAGAFAPEDIFRINFAGTRLLTDLVLAKMPAGSAITCIASTAGMGWARRLDFLAGLMATTSYDDAVHWREAHAADADMYPLSKEAIIIWVQRAAASFIRQGVRINCILPGPTQTPFMEAQSAVTPQSLIDAFTQPIGRRSTPEEQAAMLVFLNSDVASYINGTAIPVDGGFIGGVATGAIDLGALLQGGRGAA